LVAAVGNLLTHPVELQLHSNLQQAVLELQEENKPGNTSKAQDPKALEYFQYCDQLYPNDPYRYILEKVKVYNFMWYQMFCEQKARGCTKEQSADRARGIYFDLAAYNTVTEKFKVTANVTWENLPLPEKPVGPTTFTQYKAVFRKIYKVQVAT
jgi:hypothetical protein